MHLIKQALFSLSCLVIVVGSMVSCQDTSSDKGLKNLIQYVDPYIGTGGHGHVFLGANVPWGAVQLGPNNITHGWDWCSGYHISDSTIYGFAHTHLSGTGIGDLGDIAVLPFTGDIKLRRGVHGKQEEAMYSLFDRATEKVKPGYYAVHLDRYNVDVELTTTARVGFHKYKFKDEASADPKVVFNLGNGTGWDTPTEGYIVQESDSIVSGYRYSKGWANNQRIYFTAKFSEPIKNFIVSDSIMVKDGKELTARNVFGQAQFEGLEGGKEIMLKLAISPVSIENAKENMQVELAHWDFEATAQEAEELWNKELNRIQAVSSDESVMRIFYTSLYHSMIAPSLFNDVNGDYQGADQKPYKNDGFTNYTTFSLWDTYRAAHPLMTIIHSDKMPDIVNTMLYIYKHQDKLPVWHLHGNETNTMVGNPGIAVVADAYLKGIAGFDKDLAYKAMKESALKDDRGLDAYKEFGYIPFDKTDESVAKGLEYALADWAVAQVAKERGEKEDYEYFLNRSNSFKHYYDKDIQFFRGKDSKGNFRPGKLDPFRSEHRADDYTEGNAWHYLWLVPQNLGGLVELLGGEDAFITKLDSLFVLSSVITGDLTSPDISGMIGQYVHGNEPSHQILYMYPYVGQQWKTAEKVREVLTTLYDDTPEGIAGNEDVGQMSSWYIMSSLGFYQVEPAGGRYIFGSPQLDYADVHVGNGKIFSIEAKNNSKTNLYIQSISLNGKPYTKSYIEHKDIMVGGKLVYEMGAKPSETFGVKAEDRPQSVQ